MFDFKLSRRHNWLIFAIINPALEKNLKQFAAGNLLDIGCGEKPYLNMVAPYVHQHVGIDHSNTHHDKAHIDTFSNAYSIPFQNKTFDTVLCTDVLEHLEEPDMAIAESFRLLKPGGYAIYTVPFFWHLHEEPRDFYRYTRYGLEYLFKKNGYEIIEIQALSGFVVTFLQELSYFLLFTNKHIKPIKFFVLIIQVIIQIMAYMLNKIDQSYNFTIEYIAVARKPQEKNHDITT